MTTAIYTSRFEPSIGHTGNQLQGIAAVYNVLHIGGFSDGTRWPRPRKILHGAFSRALAVNRVGLVVEHDHKQTVCDSDWGLFLTDKPDGLYFTAWPWSTVEGRRAELYVGGAVLRGASWGGHCEHNAGGDIIEIDLEHVALVTEGFCPRTTARFVSAEQAKRERCEYLAGLERKAQTFIPKGNSK